MLLQDLIEQAFAAYLKSLKFLLIMCLNTFIVVQELVEAVSATNIWKEQTKSSYE